MHLKMTFFIITLFSSQSILAYEGPSPLQNIGVEATVSVNASNKSYMYRYKITNPKSNDGQITSVYITLPTRLEVDETWPIDGFTHCAHYNRRTSNSIASKVSIVAVGSTAPANWDCGYSRQGAGSYSWGSEDSPYRIKSGTSLEGYSLTSFAPPGIQNITIEPAIYYDELSEKYESEPDLLKQLEAKVKWSGKTIAPKAPPRVFSASDFSNYLGSLIEQVQSLGWIKERGISTSLEVKLSEAKKKIAAGDNKTAKNILNAFMNEVQAQNGKQITAEAYAVLYYNAKYLLEHL